MKRAYYRNEREGYKLIHTESLVIRIHTTSHYCGFRIHHCRSQGVLDTKAVATPQRKQKHRLVLLERVQLHFRRDATLLVKNGRQNNNVSRSITVQKERRAINHCLLLRSSLHDCTDMRTESTCVEEGVHSHRR